MQTQKANHFCRLEIMCALRTSAGIISLFVRGLGVNGKKDQFLLYTNQHRADVILPIFMAFCEGSLLWEHIQLSVLLYQNINK
jgi:hypothetical protein